MEARVGAVEQLVAAVDKREMDMDRQLRADMAKLREEMGLLAKTEPTPAPSGPDWDREPDTGGGPALQGGPAQGLLPRRCCPSAGGRGHVEGLLPGRRRAPRQALRPSLQGRPRAGGPPLAQGPGMHAPWPWGMAPPQRPRTSGHGCADPRLR
eukprot:5373244-Pyramimonas_sp.AAC.1